MKLVLVGKKLSMKLINIKSSMKLENKYEIT